MATLDPLSVGFWSAVGVAVLCGAIIGFERQVREHPVGIRTGALICLSTALFVSIARAINNGDADVTRVLGQIVTGVGFLGAGVIITRRGEIQGVTTAAVIWLLAGLGAAVGYGYYGAAVVLSVVTVIILAGIEALENRLPLLRKGIHSKARRD